MMRYGSRRSAAATRGRSMGWGPLTAGHSLGSVSGAGPARTDPESIRDQIYALISKYRGSLSRPTRGTWSNISTMRKISSSGRSRYSPWSRGWWLCIAFMSKCGTAILHLLHRYAPTSTITAFSHRHPSRVGDDDEDDISDIDDEQYS